MNWLYVSRLTCDSAIPASERIFETVGQFFDPAISRQNLISRPSRSSAVRLVLASDMIQS